MVMFPRLILALMLTTLACHARDIPPHPRILLTPTAEAEIKQRIKTDPLAAALYQQLIRRSDQAIGSRVCRYHIPDGKRLLRESRRALGAILHTSMAWRLTGEKKYLTRAIKELDAATSLKDWNPSHFLDTAEMSTAVAIGYDWLYHSLTDEQRHRYAKALREKGLEPARAGFTGKKKAWWTSGRNNWSQVCTTGLLCAERALEKPGTPIHPARLAAVDTLKKCRKHYLPSGGYPEGPSYWHYGSNYHALGLAVVRDDHPSLAIPTPPEFKNSPLFVEHLTGPTGIVFNFADSPPVKTRRSAAQLWMAREFNDPTICQKIRSSITQDISNQKTKYTSFSVGRFFPLQLLWLPPQPEKKAPPTPLDSLWRGTQPVATFRSSWDHPHALFLAMKGGYPGASHGQMDVGSFILESDGVRWIEDLGSDNYNMPSYFGSKRWAYFRLTNLSHNTLVIGGKLQNPKATTAEISHFSSQHNQGTASIDLTSTYQDQAHKILRACTFDRKNHSITITDSISKPTGPVRWAVMTSAEVEISGKTALLKQDGKSLRLTRHDSHGGQWVVLDAKPSQKIEKQNQGKRILAFTAPRTNKLELKVIIDRP